MRWAVLSLIVMLGCVPAAFPQTSEDIGALRRDLDELRNSQKAIMDHLDAIQKLLLQRLPAAAPQPEAFKETMLNIEGAYSMGNNNARVALIEFTDFQCPFCGRHFKQTVPQIVADYVKTGKLRYIQLDYPLEQIHPSAFKAAEAARCGGEQGKFWEMHDRLFTNQNALTADDLKTHADAVGLDLDQFSECLASGKEAAKIRSDMAEGQKNGIGATPGFLLGLAPPNGSAVRVTKRIIGSQPFANFKDAIDELLAAAR
jgi:protein-disulfide isomerase